MTANRRFILTAVIAFTLVLSGTGAIGQEAASTEGTDGKKLEASWQDFLHYIKIARPSLAKSYGEDILNSGAKAQEIYQLSVRTPNSATVLARGSRLKGLGDVIKQIQKVIEEGYQAARSDPERIAKAIDMLGGTMRGYGIAKERLKGSGEYALPQLIQKLMDPKVPAVLRERIIVLLGQMGKEAVRPLSVALGSGESKVQEVVANALGEIGYPHAGPRLKELAAQEGILPRIKIAAERALVACAGQAALQKSLAEVFHDLALRYYDRKESVLPDIRDKTANVWYWKEGVGLTYRSVPREIFCDVYAMRMARLALNYDADYYPAVSLWLAANLKRQADLPEGKEDSTYGDETPSVEYFVLASSAKFQQDVLARALRDRNSAVARGAIEALAKTSGAGNLVEPVAGGAQPLVEALSYPDRHVRFLAAASLGDAFPRKRFTGDELVMAQLIEALRQTGRKTALIIVADQERNNIAKAAARAAGYDVIDNADPAKAIAAAHRSAGVDVAILAGRPDPVNAINRLRQDPAFVTLPAVVTSQTEAIQQLAQRDGRVLLAAASATEQDIIEALKQAGKLSAGQEMLADEAKRWAIRAAGTIRNLALTETKVFNVNRAEGALIAALGHEDTTVVLSAAKALAAMQSAPGQQALAALAVDAEATEDVRVAVFDDLSASLRRFGNHLTDELADEIVEVVNSDSSRQLLDAAAQALGAMNLTSDRIKALILKTSN